MPDPTEEADATTPAPTDARRELVLRCHRILYGTPEGHALTVQERAEELADLIEDVRAEIPQELDDLV